MLLGGVCPLPFYQHVGPTRALVPRPRTLPSVSRNTYRPPPPILQPDFRRCKMSRLGNFF